MNRQKNKESITIKTYVLIPSRVPIIKINVRGFESFVIIRVDYCRNI
jgi:hypothetical protein